MLTETNALVGCLKCEAFNMIQVNKVHTFFFSFPGHICSREQLCFKVQIQVRSTCIKMMLLLSLSLSLSFFFFFIKLMLLVCPFPLLFFPEV